MIEGRLLSVSEAARRCGFEKETLRRWIGSGKLAFVKLPNGYYRIREEDLESLLRPMASKGV
ncbi:MAG: helix-turn-helix domain-containing protein [Dehalococcoidia bacterium]|nr:helix-turn-helix domain-containing protein [Dehalococcoidia bacterium]